MVNGKVINSMEKQDAGGEVTPAVTAIFSLAASREMVATARGQTDVLCSQLPRLEHFHIETSFRKAVEQ